MDETPCHLNLVPSAKASVLSLSQQWDWLWLPLCGKGTMQPTSGCQAAPPVKPPGTLDTILFDSSLATKELSENVQSSSAQAGGREGVSKINTLCRGFLWNLLGKALEWLRKARVVI